MPSNISPRPWQLVATLTAFVLSSHAAKAQFVMDVNGLIADEYRLQCCASNLTMTNNFPTLAVIDDQFTATPMGIQHANRHDFVFAKDGQFRRFNGADSFDISFDLTLDAGAISPRKEAGFIIDSLGGHHFIVNTDAHEIVAFGGFQPFYSFNVEHGISYNEGDTINMRMIYNGKTESAPGKFQYIIIKDGVTYSSPVIDSPAGEMGIADASRIHVYAQGRAATASDFFTATFENFVFGTGQQAGITGDYNADGTVDAADYVVWRKHLGTMTELPNDLTPEMVTLDDYTAWMENIGRSNAGLAAMAAIPEPACVMLVLIAGLGAFALIRSR